MTNATEAITGIDYISTATMRLMALNWTIYGDTDPNHFHHCWQYIAGDEATAADFYNRVMAEEGEDSVRWYAADALAAGGWTRTSINRRNS